MNRKLHITQKLRCVTPPLMCILKLSKSILEKTNPNISGKRPSHVMAVTLRANKPFDCWNVLQLVREEPLTKSELDLVEVEVGD